MTNIDDYFKKSAPAEPHPMARYWIKQKQAGQVVKCEFFRRWQGIAYGEAKLLLSAGSGPEQSIPWDFDVDAELIKNGIKAVSRENEIERFGMVLGHQFAVLEAGFGNAWFDALLIGELRDSGWANFECVKAKLSKIRASQASKDGRSYDSAVDAIDSVVRSAAQWLAEPLGYSINDAKEILSGAIAYFLDEHYSIRGREVLGFG